MTSLVWFGPFRSVDNNNNPLVAGQLFTYTAGTSIPQATYTDSTGVTPNTNPVILNSRGEAFIWLTTGQAYKFLLEDSSGNFIWSQDNVTAGTIPTPPPPAVPYYAQTTFEVAAGVLPVNFQYNNSPHDIRRYAGWSGTGGVDDSAAWQALALVVGKGGNAYIPPGPTMIASEVIFQVPSLSRTVIWGYGVQIYTNNTVANPYGNTSGAAYAIDGLRFAGGGNSDSLTIYGLTYNQLDAVCLSGFNLGNGETSGSVRPAALVTLVDCQVVISSTVAANAGFSCFQLIANGIGNGYWNKFIRCSTRQLSGNIAAQAPFAFLLGGQANATTIRDCYITSTNYGVGLYVDSTGSVGNAVLIDANHFEGANAGGNYCVIVNGATAGFPGGVAGANVSGLRVTNNRAEGYLGGGFVLFNYLAFDSAVPTFLSGNYLVSNVSQYTAQNNQLSLQVSFTSYDASVTPSYGPGQMTKISCHNPFTVNNIGGVGGPGDFNAFVGYQVAGTKVLGAQIAGYGTPTGGSHQPSFAAGSISLANLAAAVAQLIVDLETHGMVSS